MAVAGDGSFTLLPGSLPGTGTTPSDVAVGDFNSDGDQDLAVVNSGSSNVSILVGGSGATFSVAPGSPLNVGVEPDAVAVGDFNSDGDQDLAIGSYTSKTVHVFVGGPDAGFSAAPGSPIVLSGRPTAIAIGDFDGVLDDDLAVAEGLTDDIVVLTGGAGASFAVGSPIWLPFIPAISPWATSTAMAMRIWLSPRSTTRPPGSRSSSVAPEPLSRRPTFR